MLVRGILHHKGSMVATIGSSSTLAQAAEVLMRFGVGALVVSDGDGRIDGIISERDLTRAIAEHGAAALQRSVASAMSAEVLTCGPDDTVDELMATMTERRVRHLPVTDGGSMIGIVSIGDVVKRRVAELEGERQVLQDYLYSGR